MSTQDITELTSLVALLGQASTLASGLLARQAPDPIPLPVPPPAPTTGAISGVVRNLNGVAVDGAVVSLWRDGVIIWEVITVAGAYVFPTVDPRQYQMQLHPPHTYSLGPSEPNFTVVAVTVGATTTYNFTVKSDFWSEDFQGHTTASIRAGTNMATGQAPAGSFMAGANRDCAISDPAHITIDPDGGFGPGDKALRYDMVAHPWDKVTPLATYCASRALPVSVTPRFSKLPASPSWWVSFTCKESPRFQCGSADCQKTAGLSYKYFLVGIGNGTSNIRFGTYLGINGGATGPFLSTSLNMDMIEIGTPSSSGQGPRPTLDPVSWGGEYHTFVLEMLDIGTATCTFNVHMDNALLDTMVHTAVAGQSIAGWIMDLEMGDLENNGPDVAQTRWFRQVGVYTSRPAMRRLGAPLVTP